MKNFDSTKRLISLDMLRGLTLALMVMVNSPGSWSHVFWPLEHAEWNGITITDFVYPFFIFIIGVSIVLSTDKQLAAGSDIKKMKKKIWIRFFKIFALGILLNFIYHFNIYNIRIPGVLQRIAIVYLVCALINLSTDWKAQLKIAIIALVGYWLAMILIPVPGLGIGALEPGENLAAWIDSMLIPGKMYQGTWDPEGILSTIPAIVTGLTGMFAGHLLKTEMSIERKLNYMFMAGFFFILIGYTWDLFFPINKNLWTSSYVMFTSGWAYLAFASSIIIVDVLGYKKLTKFGVIYGSNSISIYVFAGVFPLLLVKTFGVQSLFFDGLVDLGMLPKLASFLWSFTYMLICFIPAYILYKKKIFIKL